MEISALIGRDVGFKSEITGLSYDSRTAKKGDMFFCLKGFTLDGHAYAKAAYDKGARVFVVEDRIYLPPDAKLIYCSNSRAMLALASAAFFDHPANKLYVIGITGTKGKTTTSFMIKNIFEKAGRKIGVIGTNGIYYDGKTIECHNSTPESYIIQSTMADMVKCGCDAVVMEASSQGFKMHRTDFLQFDAGLFTNISLDHIGPYEHETFADYIHCKKQILSQSKKAFVNCNMDFYAKAIDGVKTPYTTFGESNDADIKIKDVKFGYKDGRMSTNFVCDVCGDAQYIECNMPGLFSIYNAAGAIAVARNAGIKWSAIKKGLMDVYVEGRMEVVPTNTDYTVIIDFAHNALSCEKLFETIKEYHPKRIISLFGCGGNRSILRRHDMGRIIGQNSDITIVTTDHPRTESLEDINRDIKTGLDKSSTEQIYINDRKTAIETALSMAQSGDCILLIGKGHEHYDDINGVIYPLYERQIVLDYLASK